MSNMEKRYRNKIIIIIIMFPQSVLPGVFNQLWRLSVDPVLAGVERPVLSGVS